MARLRFVSRGLLLLSLLLALPSAVRGGLTVNAFTQSDLVAALANASVSTVVLQRHVSLTAGLTLSGRAVTVIGNTSGCYDPSILPPPPPSPPRPPPPRPPTSGNGTAPSGPAPAGRRLHAVGGDVGSAFASSPLDGRCTLLISNPLQARHFNLVSANLSLVNVSLTGGLVLNTGGGAVSSPGSQVRTTGGGAILADSASWVSITNSSLSYNSAYPSGGALLSLNNAPDAVVITASVLNYNGMSAVELQLASLTSNMAGGAVCSYGGVTVIGSTVSNNGFPSLGGGRTGVGTAVAAPLLFVSGCSVTGNSMSKDDGGALGLTFCLVPDNATDATDGYCYANVVDSDVSYNTGAGLVSDFSDAESIFEVDVVRCSFTGNVGNLMGGAILLSTGGLRTTGSKQANQTGLASVLSTSLRTNITIFDSTFTGNVAQLGGGAVSLVGLLSPGFTPITDSLASWTVRIIGCSFVNNTAGASGSGRGGAVSALFNSKYLVGTQPTDWSTLEVSNCTLSGNQAAGDGGAVYVNSAYVSLNSLSCVGNSATGSGGCVAVATSNGDAFALLSVVNCSLTENRAGLNGGALAASCTRQTTDPSTSNYYLRGGPTCNSTHAFTRSTLSGNVAGSQGGAMYLLAGGSLQLTQGCVLANNSAVGSSPAGGAVALADYLNNFTDPALLLDGCTLSGNVVRVLSMTPAPGETVASIFGAGSGGAVFVTATSGSGATARAAAVLSGGTRLTGNSAALGGALFLYGNALLNASDSLLSANAAGTDGGAVVLQSAGAGAASPAAVLARTTFTGNSANRGAVLVLDGASGANASSCAFTSNAASLGGGVFLLLAGPVASPTVTLTGCNATDNTAFAGALSFTNATSAVAPPSFDSASVVNNSASSYGLVIASPPVAFNVTGAAQRRSGQWLFLAAQLWDAFGQYVTTWPSVVASISCSSPVALSGPTVATYTSGGGAVFSSTAIRGSVGAAFALTVRLQSVSLSAAVTARTASANVSIDGCRATVETFQNSSQLCVCSAGYYGSDACQACLPGTYSAAGASVCTECMAGSVAPLNASSACLACPSNSLAISNMCACAAGFYDTLFGAQPEAPDCVACPAGAHCTTGTVGALEGWWRESLQDTVFLQCRAGKCGKEEVVGPLSAVTSAEGNSSSDEARRHRRRLSSSSVASSDVDEAGWSATNCVDGATGPLCSMCLPGYTMQSDECLECDPADEFVQWSPLNRALLFVGGALLFTIAMAFLFLQPLSPRLERTWAATQRIFTRMGAAAVAGAKSCLSCLVCACIWRRKKPEAAHQWEAEEAAPVSEASAAAAQPNLAKLGSLNGHSALHRAKTSRLLAAARHDAATFQRGQNLAFGVGLATSGIADRTEEAEDDGDGDGDGNAGAGLGMGLFSGSDDDDDDDGIGGPGVGAVSVGLDLMEKLERYIDKAAKIGKILLSFYQIVSTWLVTLNVPWPAVFGTVMSRLSVVNLNLVQLPKTACFTPSPRYYAQFNGYTLGMVGAVATVGLIFLLGRQLLSRYTLRDMSAAERTDRLARFDSTCLSRLLLLLYLVYPGVSVSIVKMFSCVTLNSGRSFLTADPQTVCWDRIHWRYVAAGIAWLFVVPFGVPGFFIFLLHRFRVPQLAALKVSNAWLRAAVSKTWESGVDQPIKGRPDLLTIHSVSDLHLELLVAVLVHECSVETAAELLAGRVTGLDLDAHRAADAEAEAPARPAGMVSRVKAAVTRVEHALFTALGVRDGGVAVHASVADLRRALLLRTLLHWCSTSGILALPVINWEDESEEEEEEDKDKELEPHAFQRTPTVHSRDIGTLSERAFKQIGFLFSSYHCQCWFWEVIELGRKLILTSALALVEPGSATQVTVGVLIAFLMVVLNLRLKPYADAQLNVVNTVAQLNLLAFLFVALLLKVEIDGSDGVFFNALVFALSVIPVVMPVVLRLFVRAHGSDARAVAENADI